MKKVGFVSLGCPKNLVDSEVMMGQLAEAGYEITNNADEAETVVVNTCGFIESAKQESIDAILEATSLKADGKAKRVVVAGCLVERYRDDLMKELPDVDAFIGTNRGDAKFLRRPTKRRTFAHCRCCRSAIRRQHTFTISTRRDFARPNRIRRS